MSISIDHLIADRRRTLPPRNPKPSLSMIPSSRPSLPEPMQLGHAPLPCIELGVYPWTYIEDHV
ncbi:unnamed protein product [Coregonus sp. 'balchen']|nr:unnamed protein product [Coregonus sp. 'balchen']